MTVQELIDQLQGLDPELEVMIPVSEDNTCGELSLVREAFQDETNNEIYEVEDEFEDVAENCKKVVMFG